MTHQPYRAFVISAPDITQHAHMPIFTNPPQPHIPYPHLPIHFISVHTHIPARTRAQDTHIPPKPIYAQPRVIYLFLDTDNPAFLLCQIAGTVQLGVQAWMFTNIEGMCDPHQKDHFIVCGFPLGVLDHDD